MQDPGDYHSQDELDAMGDEYFRWRYCPHCKSELPTTEEVPPYSWVHDLATGEHRSHPK